MIDGSQNIVILFADQNGICKDKTKMVKWENGIYKETSFFFTLQKHGN